MAARHILINRLVLACSFTAQDISSLIVIIKQQQQQQTKWGFRLGKAETKENNEQQSCVYFTELAVAYLQPSVHS